MVCRCIFCVYTLPAETAWRKFAEAQRKGSLCKDRRKLATFNYPVVPKYVEVPGQPPKRDFTFDTHLGSSGSWTTHYWFAVILDSTSS